MKVIVLLAALACTGCARYDAAMNCQTEAGGMPTQQTVGVVPIGATGKFFVYDRSAPAIATPEFQAYAKSVDDCMARYDAAQKNDVEKQGEP
jgi:hypothetical protein